MESSTGILLLVQLVLIMLNAVFASAEIAVLSLNETRLERMASQGNKKAKRLSRLTEEPAKFLATIQVAITLSGFLGSAFAADNFSDPLVDWLIGLGVSLPRATLDTLAVILITLILSYFTLVFGELVPKRVAMKRSETLALGLSGLISGISVIFKPLVWFLSVSTNLVLRIMGIDPHEEEEPVSEEEIRMMVDAGSEKGAIDREEQEFIQNVFEFDDLTAEEIATHRTEVVFLWLEDSIEDWAKTIHDSRHTLYPVCEGTCDNIKGILNAKDYFRCDDKSKDNLMREAVSPAYLVPETIKADVLFRNMKKSRNSMAVVMDEYGGTVGIVTLSDLIEELVGELGDDECELNEESPAIEMHGENTWLIRGNAELSEIEEATGINLPDDFDTFTGLVFDSLGTIPEDGEHDIDLKVCGMYIHVSRTVEHQVYEATIKVKIDEAPEGEA